MKILKRNRQRLKEIKKPLPDKLIVYVAKVILCDIKKDDFQPINETPYRRAVVFAKSLK